MTSVLFSDSFCIYILFGFLQRESATYNCPWENKFFFLNIPTLLKLCPCDLLIVIANANTIGNCFLYKMNGNDDDSQVLSVMRGINTLFPLFSL